MTDTPPPALSPDRVAVCHLVWVTEKTLRCTSNCSATPPHLDEYRASDVNPNR